MLKANIIKNFFKDHFNIPVKVRKVAVKNPFFQVWITSSSGLNENLKYDYQIPELWGNQLLKVIYGNDTVITFPAGNVQRNMFSINQEQWEEMMKHLYFN